MQSSWFSSAFSKGVTLHDLLPGSITHQNLFVLIKFPNGSHQVPLVPINKSSKSFCSYQVPVKFLSINSPLFREFRWILLLKSFSETLVSCVREIAPARCLEYGHYFLSEPNSAFRFQCLELISGFHLSSKPNILGQRELASTSAAVGNSVHSMGWDFSSSGWMCVVDLCWPFLMLTYFYCIQSN